MEFEEIYRLTRDSRLGLHLLADLNEQYKLDFEAFQNSEGDRYDTTDNRNVQRKMLQDSTERVVKAVPEFQSIRKSLEVAESEIERYSTGRMVDNQVVNPEELEEEITDLIDSYRMELENLWNTSIRVKDHPEIYFDPIEGCYRRWKKEKLEKRRKKEQGSESAAMEFFFADD